MSLPTMELDDLLQKVMSRFLNFTVPDLSKLKGVANYKKWRNLFMKKVTTMHCYLDFYLNDEFMSIPNVQGSTDISQRMLQARYDDLLDMLLDKYLSNELIETYIGER
ncbi:uncharacterized protein AC631_06022, partial [Debaryomyces fabryi]